jgi:hypothetical protein
MTNHSLVRTQEATPPSSSVMRRDERRQGWIQKRQSSLATYHHLRFYVHRVHGDSIFELCALIR